MLTCCSSRCYRSPKILTPLFLNTLYACVSVARAARSRQPSCACARVCPPHSVPLLCSLIPPSLPLKICAFRVIAVARSLARNYRRDGARKQSGSDSKVANVFHWQVANRRGRQKAARIRIDSLKGGVPVEGAGE